MIVLEATVFVLMVVLLSLIVSKASAEEGPPDTPGEMTIDDAAAVLDKDAEVENLVYGDYDEYGNLIEGKKRKRDDDEDGDEDEDKTDKGGEGEQDDEETDDEEEEDDEETDKPEDSEEGAEETEADEKDVGPVTLEQLAEAAGETVEQMVETLQHTFQIDGEPHTATLKDILKGYGLESSFTKKNEAFRKRESEFDRAHQDTVGKFQQYYAQVETRFAEAEAVLTNALGGQDLKEMKETDPATWAVRTQELNEQLKQVETGRKKLSEEHQEQFGKHLEERRSIEAGKLFEKVEGWGREKLDQATRVWQGLGFGDDEAMMFIDSRLLIAGLELHDLRAENKALKGEKEQSRQALRKLKKEVPRLQKPGGKKKSPTNRARGRYGSAMKELRKTGNLRDAAEAYGARQDL